MNLKIVQKARNKTTKQTLMGYGCEYVYLDKRKEETATIPILHRTDFFNQFKELNLTCHFRRQIFRQFGVGSLRNVKFFFSFTHYCYKTAEVKSLNMTVNKLAPFIISIKMLSKLKKKKSV